MAGMTQTSARPRRDRTGSRRWAVPTVIAVVAAGGLGYTALGANASSGLEPKSAQEILVGMHAAKPQPLSGTVVANADLGLPDLPGMADSAELTSLVSGSHTVRVWYGGPEKVRLAKLGSAGETDVVRNGRDLWVWSSAEKKAVHHTLSEQEAAGHAGPKGAQGAHPSPTGSMPATPQEAADKLVAGLEKDSTVTTDSVARVAGRDAYEVVLTPRQTNTLVKNVRVAVDGETMLPLRVQVNSTKLSNPAYEVGFTSIDFGDVENRLFTFTPPAGTSVEEAKSAEHPDAKSDKAAKSGTGAKSGKGEPTVTGQGWERVYVSTLPDGALTSVESDTQPRRGPHGGGDGAGDVLASLPRASGTWGSGRVLDGTLFSVVITDDGRVAVGAVDSARLTDALAKTPR